MQEFFIFLKTDYAKEFISVLELTPFGGSSETKRFIKKLENYLENEIIRAPNGERIIQKAIDYRGRTVIFFD